MPRHHFRYGFQMFSSQFLLKEFLMKNNTNGSDVAFSFFCPGFYRAMNKWENREMKRRWRTTNERDHNTPHKIQGSTHKLETNNLFDNLDFF